MCLHPCLHPCSCSSSSVDDQTLADLIVNTYVVAFCCIGVSAFILAYIGELTPSLIKLLLNRTSVDATNLFIIKFCASQSYLIFYGDK